MNRFGRGPSTVGGASAKTQCQKCLKRGHYSYECKAVAQERPYVSRPSRTQQLLNPKLVPKLSSDIPQELLRKKGIADEQLAKAEMERGRKRERQSEDPEMPMKRMRSASSVSTISTNLSRSRSRSPKSSREPDRQKLRRMSISESPRQQSKALSASPPPSRRLPDSDRKRRRDSYSSEESYSSAEPRHRGSGRSTRRRYQQASPPIRGRRPTESRSPVRERRRLSNDRQRDRGSFGGTGTSYVEPKKERSLSPFSRRVALTQAMNMGR